MFEKMGNFIEKHAGFIIGALVGLLVVILKWTSAIINIIIIVFLGYAGKYIQGNKDVVKGKIKNLIEKW